MKMNRKSMRVGILRILRSYSQSHPATEPGKRSLYLDAQATSPMDPRVLDAMLPFQTEQYGNPHSRTHAYGWLAESATERAREQVADLIGAQSKEIVFTSGATESNNIAVKGVAKFYEKSKGNHIITTQTEHKCVLESCRHLEQVRDCIQSPPPPPIYPSGRL
jgi:cysteine desulfurase